MKQILKEWKRFLNEDKTNYVAKLVDLLASGGVGDAVFHAKTLGIDLYAMAHDALIGAVQAEIEKVVSEYDGSWGIKREVVYFAPEKNYHGDINEYWDIREDQYDEVSFSVWIVNRGETFEIRDAWGKTVMMTYEWEDVPGMVNKFMSQQY